MRLMIALSLPAQAGLRVRDRPYRVRMMNELTEKDKLEELLSSQEGFWTFIEENKKHIHDSIQRALRKHLDYRELSDSLIDDVYFYCIEALKKNNCKRLHDFKGKSKLSTFLTTVVVRLTIDFLRAGKANLNEAPFPVDEEGNPLEIIDSGLNPEEAILKEEARKSYDLLQRALLEIISALSEDDRLYLKLFVMDEVNAKEVALIMKMKESDVYNRKYKLCAAIKKELLSRGVTEKVYKEAAGGLYVE